MEFPSQTKMSNEVSLPVWFLSRRKRCEVSCDCIPRILLYMTGGGSYAGKNHPSEPSAVTNDTEGWMTDAKKFSRFGLEAFRQCGKLPHLTRI